MMAVVALPALALAAQAALAAASPASVAVAWAALAAGSPASVAVPPAASSVAGSPVPVVWEAVSPAVLPVAAAPV